MNTFGQFAITITLAVGASVLAHSAISHYLSNKVTRLPLAAWSRAFWSTWADRVFLVLVITYVLVFSSLAILRYFTFHTGYTERDLPFSTSWDLGQYHQLIWNSLQGRLFEGTYVLDAHTFLGKTFTPILLAFVPLYAVWSDPILLLVVQVVGLGVSAFPIYWFGRKQIGCFLALTVCLAYFLYPGVENIGLVEFHEISLATPLLAFTTYFLLLCRHKAFLVCLGLTLLVKEEIAFITIAFGIYVFWVQRKRWLGLGLVLLGIVWSAFLLQFLIPFFRGAEFGSTFYYFGDGAIGGGGGRYGYLGSSLPQIVTTILTRPDIVAQHMLVPDKIEYVLQLLVPLAFIPLVGVEVASLALPTLGYSLLSNYPLQYSIRSYYFAPLLPFLFFGTVLGIRRLLEWRQRTPAPVREDETEGIRTIARKSSLIVLLLVASCISYYLQSPGPFGRYFEQDRYILDARAILGHQLMCSIPAGTTVVAQNEFLAHLSDRKRIYEIPIPDYRQVDYLFADTTRFWYGVHRNYWEDYLETGYFEIVTEQDGFLLARRREPVHPAPAQFADKMTLLAYTMVPYDSFRGGQTLKPFVKWRADQNIQERYTIQVHLVDQWGHVWKADDREPQNGALPTSKWGSGQLVQDQYALHFDHTMPTGEYRITLRVYDPQTQQYLEVHDESGKSLGSEFTLTSLYVEKSKSSLAPGQITIEHRTAVDMKEIRLLGFTALPPSLTKKEILRVGLYWQAMQKPRKNYSVAVQLLDPTGQVAFERVAQPATGTYPTTLWDTGEVLLDWHEFSLPNEFAKGLYQVRIVLRDANVDEDLAQTILTTILVMD